MKRSGVGVVVGRFQIHELHEGHRALLNEADKHQRMLVFIGISPYLVTPSDPLDFAAREQMVKESYPHAVVMPLPDNPSDALWSRTLDQHVHSIFPLDKATLYFGRGSSRALYSGKSPVEEIDEVPHISATDVRSHIGKKVQNDAGFRAGVIYAANNMWPRVVPAVDVAIVREQKEPYKIEVLLGQRLNEEGKHRFPGGHVDINDTNYETAAKREAAEETGGNLELSTPQYIGTYRAKGGSNWTMFTTFYMVQALYGHAKGTDDLDSVRWVNLDQLLSLTFADSHRQMAEDLYKKLSR